MKRKILIVSSEHLGPGNTLDSTFELSQAQILQKEYDVSILSVNIHNPLMYAFLSFSKSLVFFYPSHEIMRRMRYFGESLFKLLSFRRSLTEQWVIEGVDVYEAHFYPLRVRAGDAYHETVWVQAAMKGFDRYKRTRGMPHLLHAHGRFLNAGLLAREVKKKFKLPYAYTEHSSRFPSGYVPVEAIPKINQVIQDADVYIAVSEPLLRKVEETLDRNLPGAVIIPNVIDLVFQVPLREKKNGPEFRFVNVANLEHRKGIDILLRAFKRAFDANPMIQLIIVGDGPMRKELETLTAYLGLTEVVRFTGCAEKKAVFGFLEEADAFVFPSRFESFGVAVIEAMARGLPVIATQCGGPEFTVTEEQGILIDPENEEMLIIALKAVRRDREVYDSVGIHNYAIGLFGTEAFLHAMNSAYNRIINGPAS